MIEEEIDSVNPTRGKVANQMVITQQLVVVNLANTHIDKSSKKHKINEERG